MPEGQYTGERSTYEYTSDKDEKFFMVLDDTLGGISQLNMPLAGGDSTAGNPPKRFKPRVVFWQGVLDGREVRKTLVCNRTSPAYANRSIAITIDGVQGKTTGRRGERFTFPSLPVSGGAPSGT